MAELLAGAEGVTEAFQREAVETIAAEEPAWLQERRLAAWQLYEDTPLPTTRVEEWRYTDVGLFQLDELALAAPAPPAARPGLERKLFARAQARAGRVLQVDALVHTLELDPALRAKGVLLADLSAAAREYAELVEPHLATRAVPAEQGKFAALNAALWSGGVFVYVPRGVRFERPLRIARWLTRAGAAIFPRTLIIADEGSHVAFVEEFASPDFDGPALCCGAVEVFAHAAAEVQYIAVQRWGAGVGHISAQRTIAGRDASLDSLVVNLGASVARVDLAASLEGPGARSNMLGLYFGRGTQHFDHNTRQDHVAPHAHSDLLYKGGLYDDASAVFRGLIKVHPRAQRTDAYQTNRNLLLSERSRATSLPNLEIEADDVRCSHAATVGQLDKEELFYLMSRGLPRREAERLVVLGFFGEVLGRLPLADVAEEVRAAIEAKIG